MNRFVFLFCLIILVFLAPTLVGAGIPKMINYQGMLTDNLGTPLDDNYNLTFKIYGSLSGPDSLWTEHQLGVSVQGGLFNVILGSTTPMPSTLFDDTVRYLGITVGTDPELPRIRLISVGYSFRTLKSDTAGYAEGVNYVPLDSRYVNEGQANAINSGMILDNAILRNDVATNFKAPYSDTADYAKAAPGGAGANAWTFRITDTADTTLITAGAWGIARYGNILWGNNDSTHVNLGVACTTGRSGYDYQYCTVGGGLGNTASRGDATVGGGYSNTASGYEATVGGGGFNTASGDGATVGGGMFNTASVARATVGGGQYNTASGGWATVGGGMYNTASGDYSAIPGGYYDTLTASGDYSMIFGRGVYVNNAYRVVFFDSSYSGRLGINRDDRDGGISYPIHVGTGTGNGNGAYLTGGGVWTDGSSRSKKENFEKLDGLQVLDKIENTPVTQWKFKGTEERHIGPVAEDFYRAFGCGTGIPEDDSTYISAKDIAGVSLVAIQELTRMVKEQQKEIELLKTKVEALETSR